MKRKVFPLFIIILLLSPVCLFDSGCGHVGAFKRTPSKPVFNSLSELTESFSADLFREIVSESIYIDRMNIRDAATNRVFNFSVYLQNELESSLSENNFDLVYESSEAKYLVGATYQKDNNTIRIFFRIHKADGSGRKTHNYEIDVSKLPEDSFREDIKSKAYRLAANIISGQSDLKLYIRPIKEGNKRFVSDFSNSFTSRIKSYIVQLNRNIEIIDEGPIFERLSETNLLVRSSGQAETFENAEPFYARANSIMEGEYFVQKKNVLVLLFLKNLSGAVLGSSSEEIHKSLIESNLNNEGASQLIDIIDSTNETGRSEVRIFTTRGGDFPHYFFGEKIHFYVQVSEPLYVYLYNITPNGRAKFIYPLKYYGSGVPKRFVPGTLYVIPSESDDFEFEAKPPVGMESVKMFASDIRLPMPKLDFEKPSRSFSGKIRIAETLREKIQNALSYESMISPKDLVDYYRGMARRLNARLYEDSVIFISRKKENSDGS